MSEKRCSRCKRDLPATTEFFSVQSSTKSKLRSHCKQCVAADSRKPFEGKIAATMRCSKCHEERPSDLFYRLPSGKLQRACRSCMNEAHRMWTKKNLAHARAYNSRRRLSNLERAMCNQARGRARAMGIPFDITPEDISIPEFCPVLGIKLQAGDRKKHDASPSLDRIVPGLGYVRGNIAVISQRANVLKNSGTAEEHERIASWIRAHEKTQRQQDQVVRGAGDRTAD